MIKLNYIRKTLCSKQGLGCEKNHPLQKDGKNQDAGFIQFNDPNLDLRKLETNLKEIYKRNGYFIDQSQVREFSATKGERDYLVSIHNEGIPSVYIEKNDFTGF